MSALLNGWNAIALHVGRGVRTVQRWEAFGLPVSRPKGSNRSAVIAHSNDLDAWLRSCRLREEADQANPRRNYAMLADQTTRTLADLHRGLLVLKAERALIREQVYHLRGRKRQPVSDAGRSLSEKSA